MHETIEAERETIAALCRRYAVRRLELVGSMAREADFDPAASDADFLVTFTGNAGLAPLEQFFGLEEALAGLLGRPVDLIEAGAVRNPYLVAVFEEERELVYAA